jgi:cytochrome c-type biogenesis protein CcmH/NrfF
MRRWAPWLALVVVVGAALALGGRSSGPAEPEQRVRAIGATVRCPTCSGQSVAGSDAPAATNIRNEIERRVGEGESDDEIRAALARSYGESILLNPPRSGVAALVWVLPVVVVAGAAVALGLAFRRWRVVPTGPATDADRLLVERARRRAPR